MSPANRFTEQIPREFPQPNAPRSSVLDFAAMPLDPIDYQQIKMALRDCLEEEGLIGETALGPRWSGGTMVLQPANPDLKAKEVPIDIFFKKIVMLRDRLRVLEGKVNAHPALGDAEKVDLQQYVTRCQGSLTTFNVLFKDKADYFSGESQGRRRQD